MIEIKTLKFESVSFSYEQQDPIFENVDFNFPMNDMVLIKAAGSSEGRSTLLQLIAGILVPTHGQYLLNEKAVSEMSFEEFLPYRLAIGYGFDYGGLIHNKTLRDNLTLPLLYHKRASEKEASLRVNNYLEQMGITKYKNHKPSDVPGSVRKIICLLRAIIHQPQMLLLDDPSVGLTQDVFLKYLDIVSELRNAGHLKHIYMSSFDEKLINLIDHQEVFIDNRQIYVDQEPDRVKNVHL